MSATYILYSFIFTYLASFYMETKKKRLEQENNLRNQTDQRKNEIL